jgi:hypothetical protein
MTTEAMNMVMIMTVDANQLLQPLIRIVLQEN